MTRSQTINEENLLMTVSVFVKNKNKRRFGFSEIIYPNGTSNIFDIETGELVTEKQIDERYPLPPDTKARKNVDATKNYIHSVKSYK